MRPQGRPELESDARMEPAQRVARRGQVPQQVDARGEKVRNHQHPAGSPGHAPGSPGGDVGLGQLKEAGLDDRVLTPSRDPCGQGMQVVVGRLVPAAVGDQEDGGLIRRVWPIMLGLPLTS